MAIVSSGTAPMGTTACNGNHVHTCGVMLAGADCQRVMLMKIVRSLDEMCDGVMLGMHRAAMAHGVDAQCWSMSASGCVSLQCQTCKCWCHTTLMNPALHTLWPERSHWP